MCWDDENRLLETWNGQTHTCFCQRQNKTEEEKKWWGGGGKKERQCNGYCLKLKKEKCSEATSPLPMSHATLSPLVEEAWGRVTAPGQSATSMQILSGELGGWRDGTGPSGGGETRESKQEGHT